MDNPTNKRRSMTVTGIASYNEREGEYYKYFNKGLYDSNSTVVG